MNHLGRTKEERFWEKVEINGPVPEYAPDLGPCWIWTATKMPDGYGLFHLVDRMYCSHRVAYEMLVGPISDGMVVDHLCRVRLCVNPSHLEVVTAAENTRRGIRWNLLKTHCKHGHEFNEENTYHPPSEPHKRKCRTCKAFEAKSAERNAR